MTQEEQDAILGRTLRAYKEAKTTLGALKTKTKEISKIAHALALALHDHPSQILVTKGPVGALRLANTQYVYEAKDADRLGQDAIQALVEEYAKAEEEVERLRRELTEQGHELKD